MTSVPPTQPPAAPETDGRVVLGQVGEHFVNEGLTEAEVATLHRLSSRSMPTAMLAEIERILAERVRVVEGERDAVAERCEFLLTAQKDAMQRFADERAARKSAEAARATLVAAVEALADRLTVSAQKGREDVARGAETWAWLLDQYATDLRALAGAR